MNDKLSSPIMLLTRRLRFLVLLFTFGWGLVAAAPTQAAPTLETEPFDQFVASVVNGDREALRGVYVPEVLALNVKPQPPDDWLYVSAARNTVTHYSLPPKRVVGLLAHNYLAGKTFFNLQRGQEVRLVYGDGTIKYYQVRLVYQYQEVDDHFVDLRTGQILTETELYMKMYADKSHLTFQTCIAQAGNLTWGRLFVLARPMKEPKGR